MHSVTFVFSTEEEARTARAVVGRWLSKRAKRQRVEASEPPLSRRILGLVIEGEKAGRPYGQRSRGLSVSLAKEAQRLLGADPVCVRDAITELVRGGEIAPVQDNRKTRGSRYRVTGRNAGT